MGSPVFEEAFNLHAEKKIKELQLLMDRLIHLQSHTAFFILRSCFFIPKLTYFLRTSPVFKFTEVMEKMDSLLHEILETLLNIPLSDNQWTQATLPINRGGLGIRRISDVALPAFLASSHACQDLVSQIFSIMDKEVSIHLSKEALDCWNSDHDIVSPYPTVQHYWDDINVNQIIRTNFVFESNTDKARFQAVECRESGAWLHAFPSKNIGTLMDNEDFQTCIALRLGCKIYQKHICNCGTLVDETGIHGLSCNKSKGRWSRHNELNKIIQRALMSAHIHSTLEPTGLSRDDGKRPDGVTLIPWSKGQRLIWDVTCVDTLAPSHLPKTSCEPRAAAEEASKRKHGKYEKIKSSNFILKVLAFETLGPWCKESISFINDIGSALIKESGEPKAKFFLYQRISLAIQRGNAASIRGTLPISHCLDEIHNL